MYKYLVYVALVCFLAAAFAALIGDDQATRFASNIGLALVSIAVYVEHRRREINYQAQNADILEIQRAAQAYLTDNPRNEHPPKDE